MHRTAKNDLLLNVNSLGILSKCLNMYLL